MSLSLESGCKISALQHTIQIIGQLFFDEMGRFCVLNGISSMMDRELKPRKKYVKKKNYDLSAQKML